MPEAAFSLGSNLGDRLTHLQEARNRLCAFPGVRLAAQSSVYETDPIGVRPEYEELKYLNVVLVFNAPLGAEAWHALSSEVETALGRVRTEDRYAPRTIDIDLLYCDQEQLDTASLHVPHPQWSRRLFVVQPLAEVRPNLLLPGATCPVSTLLPGLKTGKEKVAVYARIW